MQIITHSLASARRKPTDQQCDCLSALSCQPCTPSTGGGSSSPSGLTGPQSEAVQRRSQGGPEHAFSLLGLRDSSQRGASTEQRTSRFIVPWVPHRAEHCNDTEPAPGLRSTAQEGQAEVFSSCCTSGEGKDPSRGREKGGKGSTCFPRAQLGSASSALIRGKRPTFVIFLQASAHPQMRSSPAAYLRPLRELPLRPTGLVLAGFPLHGPGQPG